MSVDLNDINPSEMYPMEDYAALAKISRCAAYVRAKAGNIPGAAKIHGGGWRVPGSALLAFVAQTTVEPARPRRRRRSKNQADAVQRARAAV